MLVVLLAACCVANQDTIDTSLVNTKVERSIDLNSHLAKISTTITLTNNGRSAAQSFLYAVDPQLRDSLAYIGATVSCPVLYIASVLPKSFGNICCDRFDSNPLSL